MKLKVLLTLGLSIFMIGYLNAEFALPGAVSKPTAEVTRFALETLTLRDVTFAIEVTVKNPYPVALSFGGLALDFSVEGEKVFQTQTKGGLSIPSNGQKANTFLVTLDYKAVMNLVKNYVQKDWLKTVINGKLTLPLPKMPGLPGEITFTYTLEKKIPALKPVVTIQNFAVKVPDAKAIAQALKNSASSVDPGQAAGYLGALIAGNPPKKPVIDPTSLDVPFTLSFTLALNNTAKAPLSFTGLDYRLQVDSVELLKGTSTQVKVQGTTTFVTIESTFSSKKLGETLQKTFSARKGLFRIFGEAKVTLPKEIRDTPVPLSFDESGSFAF